MGQMTQASIKVRNYMTNKNVWAVIGKNKTDVEIEKFVRGHKNNSDEPDTVIFDMKGFLGVRMKAGEVLKPGMMMVYPRSKEHFVKYDRGNFMCHNNYVFATVAIEDEENKELEFKWNKKRIRKNSDIVISENGNVNPESHKTRFEKNVMNFFLMLPVIIFSVIFRIYLEEQFRQLFNKQKRSGP